MKKVFLTALVLMSVFTLVFSLASCKGSEGTDVTVEETENIAAGKVNGGYSAELTADSLKVYKDEVFVQELLIPENKKTALVLEFAQNHINFKDLNFDGNEDICVSIVSTIDGFEYCCWIFDTEKGEFVYNETLSSLSAITIDETNKQIVSKETNADGEEIYIIYEWNNGDFVKIEEKNEKPDSAEESIIGSQSSNATTSRKPSSSNNDSGKNETADKNESDNTDKGDLTVKPSTTQKPDVEPAPETTKPGNSGSIQYYSGDLYGEEWY
ncbi:MAG: hypothetical protein IKC01_01105 [Clostridia bacterium]|nr:hypothetical protein [Clostridia bacterium]